MHPRKRVSAPETPDIIWNDRSTLLSIQWEGHICLTFVRRVVNFDFKGKNLIYICIFLQIIGGLVASGFDIKTFVIISVSKIIISLTHLITNMYINEIGNS